MQKTIWSTKPKITIWSLQFAYLHQRLVNFFCEGPDSKYFGFYRPYNLLQLFDSSVVAQKQNK